MTTIQITIICVLVILAIISYFGLNFSKTENAKTGWAFLLMFLFLICTFLLAIITIDNNELKNRIKSKCPEYEKVKNVYKLKE